MPIYEYRCENDHVFDVIQKFSDEPLTVCQECGASATRVLHSPAIHFKGPGFHNTDYGKKAKIGANGSSSEGSPGESKSDSSSGEKKSSDSKSGDSKAKAATGD